MTFPRIHIELVPLWYRRRSNEVNGDLDRHRLGEHDERRVANSLRPRSRAVEAIAGMDRDIALAQELDRAMRGRG